MKQIRIIILALPLLALPALAGGEEVSLDRCREMALENNRRIAIARQADEQAAYTVKATKANFFPKFSAGAYGLYASSANDMKLALGDIRLFDPSTLEGIVPPALEPWLDRLSLLRLPELSLKLDLNNSYLAGVSIEQPVYMGGKIHSAYRMARIGDELAALNVCLTEEEVIVETDRAYWTYVQTLELRKSAGAYKAVVEEFLRTVSNAVEAGMKSRNDLMKVQVQLNRAELQLQRADNGVRLSRMNLCQMVGLPLNSDIVPSESFGDETAPAAAGTDITARPEYTMLCKQVELKRQEQRFIQSDFLPSVGVRGGYNYTYGMKINGRPLFDNGGFSAMIAVSIPLFHWGEGMNKVRAAKAETAMAELQRDEMAEKMELEAQQALNAVNEYILEVRLTESALSQAEENMQTSGNFYEAGMEPISDYLEAQAIWQNASAEYIAARAKLAISRSEYMKAAGLL